jgi:hypothetical protein
VKLSEAVACFEKCFSPENNDGSRGCLYENCPLHDEFTIVAGAHFDEEGQITWKIGGCSLLAMFENKLKRKKAGTPYPELEGEP